MLDLLVIGGGINGAAIARDGAGRGLKTLLCEKDDLASHTSAASSKMIHGGLRYLENYEFKLVRESLVEREILLRAAPHVISPARIVLPVVEGMRPKWLLRAGLFLYDHLAGRSILPGTSKLNLRDSLQGRPLKQEITAGFEYSDCFADDSRLVVLNAMDAAERGADIRTRTECTELVRKKDHWIATLRNTKGVKTQITTRSVINAAGPWVENMVKKFSHNRAGGNTRLVKGSHIVVNRLYEGDHGYIFQSADGRVIFALPYMDDYTLIGTTESEWSFDQGEKVEISQDEIDYLVGETNSYFEKPLTQEDIVWCYAGVRPLYNDDNDDVSVTTRDYVFDLDTADGMLAPVLSVFGGKLTTHRKLAAQAIDQLAPVLGSSAVPWTADATLPGGDFSHDGLPKLITQLQEKFPWMPDELLQRMTRAYGTRVRTIVGEANSVDDLGHHFGAGLYEAEVEYLRNQEFATTAEDMIWRRTKLGLRLSDEEISELNLWPPLEQAA